MSKTVFKVGDNVKILKTATVVGVEHEDVGKVGVITYVDRMTTGRWGILVKMNETCIARGYIPEWSVGYSMIELSTKKGEQLQFDFMK